MTQQAIQVWSMQSIVDKDRRQVLVVSLHSMLQLLPEVFAQPSVLPPWLKHLIRS